ncbi:MAG: hypothetical protein PUH54_01830 [Oscillospiraceae bacterium]|nr:hypothetical protein [Oscillospiraceae bacterium]
MNSNVIGSLNELKQNFSIDELVYCFCSGELEIWLRKIGESALADKVSEITYNGYVLENLYRLFCIDPALTESEVRSLFSD